MTVMYWAFVIWVLCYELQLYSLTQPSQVYCPHFIDENSTLKEVLQIVPDQPACP